MKILSTNILRHSIIIAATLLAIVAPNNASAKRGPLKALIVTGQNNHNWPVSSVALKAILERSGMFAVTTATSPAAGADMSSFVVDFNQYDVVVLDYNGDRWPAATDESFRSYVLGGGGVVVYHAANNAFSQWPFFNEVIALGGWENRSEKSGPYLYIKDGALVKDSTAGPGGGHGAQHEFVMNVFDAGHPTTKGMPREWKHATDELYGLMRGPANVKSILYSAFSDSATGGSGREEPLLLTVDKGKARIFHTMLGHAGADTTHNTAMQCVGFQTTLLRGAEWAATGKVTQPIPSDFPTSDRVSLRPHYQQ